MRKVLAIVSKELRGYFQSPLAYVLVFLTIGIFDIFFFIILDENKEVTLRDMFKLMEFMFIFIVPLLTMKVFSEEKMTGTMEFLLTTPVRKGEIVLGKYLGALLFYTFILVCTGFYYLILEIFGNPDRWAIMAGYLGIWLEGAYFIAIGLLISSMTRSQITAAILSYVTLMLLYFSISFIKYFSGTPEALIHYLSSWSHMESFSVGILSLADVSYFVSGIVVCLVLTRISLNTKIWN
jgi:ABC-2 type transport system permease protein